MSLIVVKKKVLMPLPQVWFHALRYCYRDCLQDPEEKKITVEEIRNVFENVKWWKGKIEADKFRRNIATSFSDIEEEEIQLGIIAQLLRDEMEGELEEKKTLFRDHHIDYKKYYRIPGAVKAKDVFKAQEIYKEYERENPEQEAKKGVAK